MQVPGNYLLAGAGFSKDKDIGITARDLLDQLANMLDRPAAADPLDQRRGRADHRPGAGVRDDDRGDHGRRAGQS